MKGWETSNQTLRWLVQVSLGFMSNSSKRCKEKLRCTVFRTLGKERGLCQGPQDKGDHLLALPHFLHFTAHEARQCSNPFL